MKYLILPVMIFLLACEPELTKQDMVNDKHVRSQSTDHSYILKLIQFRGLERIYFERVRESEALTNLPEKISTLLPRTLEVSDFSSESRYGGADEYEIMVRDFHIPVKGTDLWLREVINHEHHRISKLWWAIYYNGKRSDLWYFTASPSRTENKMIPNYRLDSAYVTDEGLVMLQVRGTMFRPGGFWQLKGITLTFSPEDGDLMLDRVQNVFSILHGYNAGDTLDIKTETVVENRFEHRSLNSVSEDLLSECGLWFLLDKEPWEFSWADLERGASCVTARPGTEKIFRSFDEPSFIERGWKSK